LAEEVEHLAANHLHPNRYSNIWRPTFAYLLNIKDEDFAHFEAAVSVFKGRNGLRFGLARTVLLQSTIYY
jgi:hypothetical protein